MSTNSFSESAILRSLQEEASLFPADVVIPSSVHPGFDEKYIMSTFILQNHHHQQSDVSFPPRVIFSEDSFAAINASYSSLAFNDVRQDLRFHHRINGQDKTVFISPKLAGGGCGTSKNKIAPRPSQSGGSSAPAPVLVQVQPSKSSQVTENHSLNTLPSSNAVVHQNQQAQNPQKSSTQAAQSLQPPKETPIAPAPQNPSLVTPPALIPSPSVDPAIFVDWPEEPVLDSPENGLRLGLLLQKQFDEGNQDEIWRKRALRMIRLFMEEPTATDDNLNEIVPLSKAAHGEISEKLITAIGEKLEKGTEDPTRLLSALNIVLSNTLQQNFNVTLLGTVLDILVDKIGNVFASDEKTSNKITETIVSILNCLYVSGATGIPQEKYKTYKESFDQSWIDKALEKRGTNEQERAITAASQAKRALFVELLKRIGDDQNSVVKGAKIAGKVALGLFNVATAVVSFDVSSAISALGDAAEALSEIEVKKKWFDTYIGFRLSLSSGVEKAIEFVDSLKLHTIHPNAAFLIADCVSECYCATYEGAKRKEVFELLEKLTTYANWPKDADLKVYVEITKKKMLDYKPQKTVLKSKIFGKAGHDEIDESEVIFSIKEATTKNEEFNGRFANYIPCQAERPARKGEAQDAMDLIKEFLSPENKRKVLLILGDSGSGKSLLQQYTVRELWAEYESGKHIPLYVPLTALKNPRENAIYELLSASTKNSMSVQGLEFSEDNIKLMKNDKRPFIFFLDAFDEIEFNQKSIHESNNLAEWPNAKVVIGCRRQFLNNISNYQKLFASLNHEGNPEPIDEIHILPFTKEQRVQYFDKYVELHPECEWKGGAVFEKNLQLIHSLVDLAVTPFMIFLAATTLPDIQKKKNPESKANEQVKMMRTEFFRQFAESWFDREDKKLTKSKSFLPKDFPKNFSSYLNSYCLKLANIMLSRNENALRYDWDYFENKSNDNDLDRFFGNNPEWLDIVRRASPIKTTSATTYEFIHKSVYEFFAGDDIFNQFTLQEDEEQEVLQSTLPADDTTTPPSAPDQSSEKPAPVAVAKEPSKKKLANVALKLLTSKKDNQGPVNALNKTIEYSILLNLSEQVNKSDSYKRQLFEIIHLSKSDETKAQAAANAITILNYAGVSFTNMNFSGVRIPGADLSRSILDGANLTGANLNNVSFIDACLGSCVFNEASMEGVKFGRHPLLLGHTAWVKSVSSVNGPNGECCLASGSEDETIRIWDIASGSEIKTLNGHTRDVNSVCSINGPNGECWLASGSSDETIRIWDIATGLEIKTLNGHSDYVNSVCSVNGPKGECWLASGSDYTIRIWDIATGLEIKTLNGHTDLVNSVCSVNGPNGECWLASGSDYTIRIWDIASGSEIKTLNGHTSYVHSVCSVNGPNGECWLASGSHDRTVRIWDISSGSEIKTLNGHTGDVRSVCSVNGPNGECWLASGSVDKTIHIWVLETGLEIKTLNGHASSVRSVCSVNGPNGECWLASGSGDNTIRIWDIATGSEIHKLDSNEATYTKGAQLVRRDEPDVIIAQFQSIGAAMQMFNTEMIMDVKTKYIIGPRRLEGGDMQLRSVIGLSKLNRALLLQEGGVSYDADFAKYCDSGRFTKLQARMMAQCHAEGWGVEKDIQFSMEWFAKALDFESLKQHALNGSKDAFDVLLKLAEEMDDDEEIKHPDAAKIVAECYAEGWGVEKSIPWQMYWQMRAGGNIHDFESLKQHALNGSKDAFDVLLKLAEEMDDDEEIKHPDAAKIVAECYAEGWGVEKSIPWQMYWQMRAGGNIHDFESLKQHAQNGSKDAFDVLLKIAQETNDNGEIKHPEAAKIVAECYAEGWVVEKDLHRSTEWFRILLDFDSLKQHAQNGSKDTFDVLLKLAEETEYGEIKHPQAAKIVAECYAEGWSVEKDSQKAHRWLCKSLGKALDSLCLKQYAQNGSKEAFDVLLILAEETDDNEEIKYPYTAYIVAECYAEGWGVEKSIPWQMYWKMKGEGKALDFDSLKQHAQNGSKEAFNVLLKIAEETDYGDSGDAIIKYPQAAYIVAECYAEGWGVEKSIPSQLYWQMRAERKVRDFESLKQHAQNGSKEAFDVLLKLAEEKEQKYSWSDEEVIKYPQAAKIAAECYAEGWGVEKDLQKSIEWFGIALDFESLKHYAQNGSKDAFDVLLKLAQEKKNGEIKHPEAAKIVAECYAEGWGVKKSIPWQMYWQVRAGGRDLDFESLKQHAQNGSKEAFDVLLKFVKIPIYGEIKYRQAAKIVAECYAEGWGVEKSIPWQMYWKVKAEGGIIINFKSLKQHAQNGSKEAFDVLLKLAEEKEYDQWGDAIIKYPQAAKIVAECYAEGWGVENDT